MPRRGIVPSGFGARLRLLLRMTESLVLAPIEDGFHALGRHASLTLHHSDLPLQLYYARRTVFIPPCPSGGAPSAKVNRRTAQKRTADIRIGCPEGRSECPALYYFYVIYEDARGAVLGDGVRTVAEIEEIIRHYLLPIRKRRRL